MLATQGWNKQKTFVPERGITAKEHRGRVKLKLAKKHRNTNSSKETQERERLKLEGQQ